MRRMNWNVTFFFSSTDIELASCQNCGSKTEIETTKDLEEDSVAPKVVPEGCELVDPPLGEGPGSQLILPFRPGALRLKDGVD